MTDEKNIGDLIAKEDWNRLAELKATDSLIDATKELNLSDVFQVCEYTHILDALGKIGDTKAINFLIKSLDSSDTWIVETAISSLKKIGDATSVEALIHCIVNIENSKLGDDYLKIIQDAAIAL